MTTEDAIKELASRIDVWEDYRPNDEKWVEVMKMAKQALEAARWRKADEELPDRYIKVLCCTVTKKGYTNRIIGYWDDRWCCGMNSNVVAWMPLPRYEEGEHD